MTDDPNRTQNQDTAESDIQNPGSTRNPSVEDINRKNPSQNRDVETDLPEDRDEDERKAS
jgi:hypothetical protein